MAESGDKPTPRETARAAQAFADYVALGPDRSLEKLEAQYRSGTSPGPTRQLSRLKEWSTEYGWQDRLKALAAEQIALGEEMRRRVYLRLLRQYDRRTEDEDALAAAPIDHIHGVYDRVKPADKLAADLSLDITATVEIVGVDEGDV